MAGEKKSGISWLYIVGLLWGGISPICLGLGLFFIAFYDSPMDPKAGMGLLDYTLIWSVLSFPVICFISSLGIWFLKNRNKRLASYVALLPIIPLTLIFAIFAWVNSPKTQEQGEVISASECVSPVLDGGDGLTTTGCGSLEIGVRASGATSTTAEAHNWQFSTQTGQIKITIENDGNSCPHIIVLDSSGRIVEGFDDENSLIFCPNGLTTTSFYKFAPPNPGTYIVRLFTPDTPGAYWLKIE